MDIDQKIPLPDSGRQATILISLGDDGSLGRYFVNMPDSDGNADKLAPLRPAPEKVKQYPDRPADFTISRDDKLDVLLLAGPGAKRFRFDDIGELNPPGEVRWTYCRALRYC